MKLLLSLVSLLFLSSCTDGDVSRHPDVQPSNVRNAKTIYNYLLTAPFTNQYNQLSQGLNLDKDKQVKISINYNLNSNPIKYKVIVRNDPTRNVPMTIVMPYDSVKGKYEFDTSTPNPDISIKPGSSVSIKLLNVDDFYSDIVLKNANTSFNNTSTNDSSQNNTLYYSSISNNQASSTLDNKILYFNKINNYLDGLFSCIATQGNGGGGGETSKSLMEKGVIKEPSSGNCSSNYSLLNNPNPGDNPKHGCNNIYTSNYRQKLCDGVQGVFDSGTKMSIKVGENEYKTLDRPFYKNRDNSLGFFFTSSKEGNLNFGGPLDPSSKVLCSPPVSCDFNSPENANKFHAYGRYLLLIEISGEPIILRNEKISFYVGSDVNNRINGSLGSSPYFSGNSPESGPLFIKINDANNVNGNILLTVEKKYGNTNFSNFLQTEIIDKIKTTIMGEGNVGGPIQIMFQQLSRSGSFILFTKAALTIYISLTALFFLIGITKITGRDFFIRATKVIIVTQLFSPNSWYFFHAYLFGYFIDGTDYLLTSITGQNSASGELFSFIDPIINKYFGEDARTMWTYIGIYLLSWSNGLVFIGIILLLATFRFLFSIFFIYVSYLLAFVGISLMIVLAPFFITAFLFTKTEGMFMGWIKVMLNYVFQPFIAVLLLIICDRLTDNFLENVFLVLKWSHLFTIPLPIASISFYNYVPQLNTADQLTKMISGALLLYSISNVVHKVVDIAGTLTNALFGGEGPGPVSDAAKEMGSFATALSRSYSVAKGTVQAGAFVGKAIYKDLIRPVVNSTPRPKPGPTPGPVGPTPGPTPALPTPPVTDPVEQSEPELTPEPVASQERTRPEDIGDSKLQRKPVKKTFGQVAPRPTPDSVPAPEPAPAPEPVGPTPPVPPVEPTPGPLEPAPAPTPPGGTDTGGTGGIATGGTGGIATGGTGGIATGGTGGINTGGTGGIDTGGTGGIATGGTGGIDTGGTGAAAAGEEGKETVAPQERTRPEDIGDSKLERKPVRKEFGQVAPRPTPEAVVPAVTDPIEPSEPVPTPAPEPTPEPTPAPEQVAPGPVEPIQDPVRPAPEPTPTPEPEARPELKPIPEKEEAEAAVEAKAKDYAEANARAERERAEALEAKAAAKAAAEEANAAEAAERNKKAFEAAEAAAKAKADKAEAAAAEKAASDERPKSVKELRELFNKKPK